MSRVDYSLAKIYKLKSESGLEYIGSTCEPDLKGRLGGHIRSYYKRKGGKTRDDKTFKLFDEGVNKVKIELIMDFPCETYYELRTQEKLIIKQNSLCR